MLQGAGSPESRGRSGLSLAPSSREAKRGPPLRWRPGAHLWRRLAPGADAVLLHHGEECVLEAMGQARQQQHDLPLLGSCLWTSRVQLTLVCVGVKPCGRERVSTGRGAASAMYRASTRRHSRCTSCRLWSISVNSACSEAQCRQANMAPRTPLTSPVLAVSVSHCPQGSSRRCEASPPGGL